MQNLPKSGPSRMEDEAPREETLNEELSPDEQLVEDEIDGMAAHRLELAAPGEEIMPATDDEVFFEISIT